MGLLARLRRKPHERAGFALYGAAVSAARAPLFFERLGVPDTLDGRFDLVGLHVALLIRRLRRDPDPRGPALAQAVFDAMFSDMDRNLREMGVGDLSVPRRVKAMWTALHGRARAYDAALDAGDVESLAAALRRNVWRTEEDGTPDREPARHLARLALTTDAGLLGQPFGALLAGKVQFQEPVPADAA